MKASVALMRHVNSLLIVKCGGKPSGFLLRGQIFFCTHLNMTHCRTRTSQRSTIMFVWLSQTTFVSSGCFTASCFLNSEALSTEKIFLILSNQTPYSYYISFVVMQDQEYLRIIKQMDYSLSNNKCSYTKVLYLLVLKCLSHRAMHLWSLITYLDTLLKIQFI